MNDHILSSQCSSGCESGWTLYLEHSFLSPHPSHRADEFSDGRRGVCREVEENLPANDEVVEEEEEDLSMVSDASSGPPILREDEYYGNAKNGYFYKARIDDSTLPKNSGKRKKKKKTREIRCEEEEEEEEEEEHPSFLDDTASSSSPIFNFSQNNFSLTNNQASMENILDFPNGCSSTHLEGRSALYEPFGFFQPSLSGNQLQQNQWFGGKMGMRWK